MIEVLDNLFDNQFTNEVEDITTDNHFPYFLASKGIATVDKEFDSEKGEFKQIKEYLQFVHLVYRYDKKEKLTIKNSTMNTFADKIFDKVKQFSKMEDVEKYNIHTCKINFQTQHKNSNKDVHNTPHVDDNINHYAMLYYVNDSDGDTFFFDTDSRKIIKRISPKKGRVVIFDGTHLHTGNHPINKSFRIVFNFNLTREF